MDGVTRPNLNVRQERFWLQARLLSPVFDLFKDLPALCRHLFDTLGPHYNLRLTDMRFETGAGSLGEVSLRFLWPSLADVRIFLDRVEIESDYPQFLRFEEKDLVFDVLRIVAEYIPETRFRAYSVTQDVHGSLIGGSRHDFLARFACSTPEGFGPALGAGIVFYFGAEADHLAASVTLDFSRVVEGGVFVQSAVLYDASRVAAGDLQAISFSRFESLIDQLGLARQ